MPETQPTDASERSTDPSGRRLRHFVEWVVILAVALTMSVVVRDYAFQTFYIPSGSMEPTLLVGDRIIIDKLAVELGTVHTGDIIVFHAPREVRFKCGAHDVDLVKRVIGTPGDHISSSGDTILINGVALQERWGHLEPLGPAITPRVVPKNEYFVMGDNHSNSCDSRYWGMVPRGNILGKVFLRVWPVTRIHWF
jgi:signal peptidase I